jgi:glycerol uptake facilitator-like aquaporin
MTIRKVKPLQCIFYVIGQVLGAFLGGVLVYLVYLKQFDEFDGALRQMTGPNGTADIFFTMPAKGISQWNALVDQIVCTGILLIFVMSATHVRKYSLE